ALAAERRDEQGDGAGVGHAQFTAATRAGGLPLPACGERVGVRGNLMGRDEIKIPLTRIACGDPTSPRKRGEVKKERAPCVTPQPLSARATRSPHGACDA